MGKPLDLTVDDDGLRRALSAFAGDLDALDETWEGIARQMEAGVRPRIPVLSGALAGTLATRSTGSSAELSVGGSLPYARVIDNGWRAHNIEPAYFSRPAVELLTEDAAADLERGIQQAADRRGLD
ncbi:hypothetical protein GCM10023340_38920 [Nocardioides marinquilinus]|uniref:HK97 gp10 family phage protein n=1 Tax=Nocardioides marinquilinus TaxID=1210400 RepID=A0ABP9PZP1_9ACTN